MNITCLGISWRLPEWTIVLYRSTAMTMRIRVELNTGIAGAVFTTLQSTLAEGSQGQYWKGETGMQLRANIYLYSVNIQIVSKKKIASTSLLSGVLWKLQISSKFYLQA